MLNHSYICLYFGSSSSLSFAHARTRRQPTNHLDVEAIEWLEKLLAERSLTFVCVTHDRYFLENVCQEIIELDSAKLYRYVWGRRR